jgi:TolB-like protein
MMARHGIRACAAMLAVLVPSLGGCDAVPVDRSIAPMYGVDFPMTSKWRDTDIVTTSYAAADRLMNAAPDAVDQTKPILVTSVADIDNLDQSSAFGRIVSEQIASRLTQLGYMVVESKLRGTLAINANGEFMLSRDARKIAAARSAQAVVTGSYAAGEESAYVSLKLVRLADAKVVAAFDYSVPMGPNTRSLLVTSVAQP